MLGGVILIQGSSIAGVCYSDTEEHSAESVLFYFRVEVALEVCYSNTEEEQRW